jgi:hypothetical protein
MFGVGVGVGQEGHAAEYQICMPCSSLDALQQHQSAFCLDLSHYWGSVVTSLDLLCEPLAVCDVPTRHVPAGLLGTSVKLSVRFVPKWQDTTLAVGGVAGSTTAFWSLVDAPPAPCAHIGCAQVLHYAKQSFTSVADVQPVLRYNQWESGLAPC